MTDEHLQVEKFFLEHIGSFNSRPSNAWYVGITDNHEERYGSHGRPTTWYPIRTSCENAARLAEKWLIEKYRFSGDSGGGAGNGQCRYIYCYLITPQTIE